MKKNFISIIWGYSTHFYGFSPEENYHLHTLKVAKELGFEPFIIVVDSKEKILQDPNFDNSFNVLEYKNILNFLYVLIKFSLQNSIFYVNSYEWQSFIVPFLARRTIFMAHTQPKRKTWLKQKIQNFVYKFFTAIRLNNETERDFLIKEKINPKKLFVIPLIVSNNIFKLTNPETNNRKDLVYFGNITAKKNVLTILKAFEKVKETLPEIKMNLIGNMWDDQVRYFISKSKFKESILVYGFLPNEKLGPALNKNLIYLNSSLDEGQCVAVYDAALSGCALCLPKIMSFVGVFKDSALFHNVYDHEELARNILYYIEHPEIIKRHTAENIKMISENYSIECVENKMKELFLKI
jgi:glycosyltransferase involved in cell wall biosynthesis